MHCGVTKKKGKSMSEDSKKTNSDVTHGAKRIPSWTLYSHPVALVALSGVEVEDKERICPVKHNDLVPFMLGADVGLEGEKWREKKS